MTQTTAISRITHEEAEREVEANYEAFLEMLPTLMETNHGEWAVLRGCELIATHPTLGQAYDSAFAQYPDHRFSIEEIDEQEPINVVFHFAGL